jgi:hypothetical protein
MRGIRYLTQFLQFLASFARCSHQFSLWCSELIVRLELSSGRNRECIRALFWADFTSRLLGLSLPLACHDRQRFAGGSGAIHSLYCLAPAVVSTAFLILTSPSSGLQCRLGQSCILTGTFIFSPRS